MGNITTTSLVVITAIASLGGKPSTTKLVGTFFTADLVCSHKLCGNTSTTIVITNIQFVKALLYTFCNYSHKKVSPLSSTCGLEDPSKWFRQLGYCCVRHGDVFNRIETVMDGNTQEGGSVAAMALFDYPLLPCPLAKKIRGMFSKMLI